MSSRLFIYLHFNMAFLRKIRKQRHYSLPTTIIIIFLMPILSKIIEIAGRSIRHHHNNKLFFFSTNIPLLPTLFALEFS